MESKLRQGLQAKPEFHCGLSLSQDTYLIDGPKGPKTREMYTRIIWSRILLDMLDPSFEAALPYKYVTFDVGPMKSAVSWTYSATREVAVDYPDVRVLLRAYDVELNEGPGKAFEIELYKKLEADHEAADGTVPRGKPVRVVSLRTVRESLEARSVLDQPLEKGDPSKKRG